MKKAQRLQKRQEHADAYKQGFDDGFRLGYQVAMQEMKEAIERQKVPPERGACEGCGCEIADEKDEYCGACADNWWITGRQERVNSGMDT